MTIRPDAPCVSVVMPCYNEGRYIAACLRSVLEQSYPREKMEILVADGRSSDDTRAKIASIAAADPRVRLIDNPERHQAAGLNRALAEARADILVRMDSHCEYASDYVERCVEVMEREGADVVGGPQRIRSLTSLQAAAAAALESPLGMGGAPYRREDRSGFVDTVFLGTFRRSVFEKVGLYDEAAVPNEDADLNQRVVRSGGRIYLDPAIRAYYHPRDSFRRLARQYFEYGRGRARTMVKQRGLLTARPALPFLGLVCLAALLALARHDPRTLLLAAGYPLACLAEAVRVARRGGPGMLLRAWAVFPTLHFSHAAGFGFGLVRYLLRPDWTEQQLLPPRAAPPAGSAAQPEQDVSAPGR
jgi:GT2 family glycosyltransferase